MFRGVLKGFLRWWNSPSLLDQFQSLPDQEVLELTEDMIAPNPFGRYKRKIDASR